MSNHPTAPHTSTDRPTATYQTGCPTGSPTGQSPFAGWRDATPTELLPVVGSTATPSRRERSASTTAGTASPRVSTHHNPTAGRETLRAAPTGTKGLRRHLRAALAGIALAAALLGALQLLALDGIAQARQAALAERNATPTPASTMSGQTAPMSDRTPASQPDVRSDIQADWVTEDTGAAYDRTDPAASPLDLPRCTTSPDTPLPCLATISSDSRRAVVLEEDTSLTALVRR